MGTPLLTWLMLIGIIAVVFAIDGISAERRRIQAKGKHPKVIENGSEREMFFIPGDPFGVNVENEEDDDL